MVRLEDVDEIAREHRFARTDTRSVLPELSEALASLIERDAVLLERGAAERAVCHRLAVYVEATVNQRRRDDESWHVDCEYNLFGSSIGENGAIGSLRKWMVVEGIADEPDAEQVHSVYPDLIVHRRDTTANLLVIEMKVLRSSTRPKDVEFDFRKLMVFHEPGGSFNYREAVLVLVLPGETTHDGAPDRVALYAAPVNADELHMAAAMKDLAS